MKLKIFSGAALLAATMIPAQAASITATFGFVNNNYNLAVGGSTHIGTATSITFSNGNDNCTGGLGDSGNCVNNVPADYGPSQPNYFSAHDTMASGDPLQVSPLTLNFVGNTISTVSPFVFLTWGVDGSPGKNYTFTVDQIMVGQTTPTIFNTNGTLAFQFFGMLHDESGAIPFNTAAEVFMSLSQSAGTINYSATFSDPPADDPPPTTPEPATMGLFGSALVGFGLIGRKKFRK
jgi:hypothetical protein